jgi:hypothetical protein
MEELKWRGKKLPKKMVTGMNTITTKPQDKYDELWPEDWEEDLDE